MDFVDGLITYGVNGDVGAGIGIGVHCYAAKRSMEGRAFQNSDGELLIVRLQGRLRVTTEMGIISVQPQQIAVIPRDRVFADRPAF
jgi:homogentisate 1,2-dioxygenase